MRGALAAARPEFHLWLKEKSHREVGGDPGNYTSKQA